MECLGRVSDLAYKVALCSLQAILADQGHPDVKNFLGHRSITSTMKYLQLVEFKEEDQFICKAVTSADEAAKLIEAGFTYETAINGVSLFKKRK